jgi:hypothetical protein
MRRFVPMFLLMACNPPEVKMSVAPAPVKTLETATFALG